MIKAGVLSGIREDSLEPVIQEFIQAWKAVTQQPNEPTALYKATIALDAIDIVVVGHSGHFSVGGPPLLEFRIKPEHDLTVLDLSPVERRGLEAAGVKTVEDVVACYRNTPEPVVKLSEGLRSDSYEDLTNQLRAHRLLWG